MISLCYQVLTNGDRLNAIHAHDALSQNRIIVIHLDNYIILGNVHFQKLAFSGPQNTAVMQMNEEMSRKHTIKWIKSCMLYQVFPEVDKTCKQKYSVSNIL